MKDTRVMSPPSAVSIKAPLRRAFRIPDLDVSYPDPAKKYPVIFRRESDQMCLSMDDLRDEVASRPQNPENSLYFSLIPGKLHGETGSQLTAPSASPCSCNILRRSHGAPKSPFGGRICNDLRTSRHRAGVLLWSPRSHSPKLPTFEFRSGFRKPLVYNHFAPTCLSVLHRWVGFLVIAFVVVHVGAALCHQFIRGDEVLKRMLPEALGGFPAPLSPRGPHRMSPSKDSSACLRPNSFV